MNFKKPKKEVIRNANEAASYAVSRHMGNLKYNYGSQSGTSIVGMIEMAICDGILAAIESIVEDTYTDQEFEEDLQLKT